MSHNQGRGGKYPAAIIACQQKHWLQLLRQQPNCGRFEHWNPDQKINEKKTFKEGMWLYILVAKRVWGSQKAFHWKFLQWQVNNWEFWWQALAQCTKTLLWKTNLVDLSDVDVYSVCRQIFLKNENSLKFQYWKNIFPLNTQFIVLTLRNSSSPPLPPAAAGYGDSEATVMSLLTSSSAERILGTAW